MAPLGDDCRFLTGAFDGFRPMANLVDQFDFVKLTGREYGVTPK
jgi:hypothetical protein